MTQAPTRLPVLDETGRALLFTDARTANSFADTPVSDEELTAIWSLAQWPPTAANTQPLRLLWVRTPEGKQRLAPHMSEGNRDKTVAAPATAVLAIDREFYEHIPTIFPLRPELREVFSGNPAAADGNAAFSGALQAGYVILAIRAVGLAAGPMAGFDAAGIDAEFFPGGRFHAVLVVNVGHPADDAFFPRQPRLAHDVALSWA
jgi:3-hydroxypropanoate dehydrogenase